MTQKPSQPDFQALDEPTFGESPIERPGTGQRKLSVAETFSSTAQAIRNTRGDTGTLSLRAILPAQLTHSRFIEQFPQSARPQWIEIITELMVTAKAVMANGSPVDFYQKYRRIKEDEELKPASEKLLFVERLADALTGTSFTFKEGSMSSQWVIILCTSDELAGAAPAVLARNEGNEIQKFQLVQVMSGLKIV